MFESDQYRNSMQGVTNEEIGKLTKAMKDKEFKNHMDEYIKEVSDPKHKKEYLDYLAQLEAKGEMPEGQRLLRAEPGCCVKTTISFKNGQTQKCFINIVHSTLLEDMSMTRKDAGGHSVNLPYSLAPPRPDRDKKDEYCLTCDFAVGYGTFMQAIQNPNILKMLVDTAADGLGQNFLKGFEEVKKDFKVMQQMRCKGNTPMPMSVRAELLKDKGKGQPKPKAKDLQGGITPGELKEMRKEAKKKMRQDVEDEEKAAEDAEKKAEEKAAKQVVDEEVTSTGAPRIRVPKHTLVHSGTIDLTDYMEASNRPSVLPNIPRLLKLNVELPTVKRSSDITLEVTRNNVVIEVDNKYYLDLPLSYDIQEDQGVAKFDKAKQSLTLELPVIPKIPERAHWEMPSQVTDVTHDGSLSEHGENSDEELPPLQDEAPAETEETSSQVASDREATKSTEKDLPETTGSEASPSLQRLELEPQNSSLRIANSDVVDESAQEGGVEEVEDETVNFYPSETFTGAREGYCFKTGDEGLGYYRDARQSLSKKVANDSDGRSKILLPHEKSQSQSAPSSEPLVMEVTPAEPSEESSKPSLIPLPAGIQQYVDSTTLLKKRIASSDIDSSQAPPELPLVWKQTRQNLILSIALSADDEVADVQVLLVGRRMRISFCTRHRTADSGSTSSSQGCERWTRNQLRRTLYQGVDAQQWHASVDSLVAGAPSLRIVIRKSDQGVKWVEAFDTSAAAVAAAASMPEPMTDPQELGGSLNSLEDSSCDSHSGAAGRTSANADDMDDAIVVEDSAELDIATPQVHASSNETGPVANNSATASSMAAAAQSAAVMGQAVLLRSRLMYELL